MKNNSQKSNIFLLVFLAFSNVNFLLQAQSFYPVGGGTNFPVECLFSDTVNHNLYAGGHFWQAGSIPCNLVAKWNGLAWDSLKNDLSGGARSINIFNDSLYVGGGFSSFDTTTGQFEPLSGLIKWDSANKEWLAFPASGLYGNVEKILNYNSSLYVMGNFDSISGFYSSKIAKYDGTNWVGFPPLDVNGGGWSILDGIFYNGDLYVGGNFESQVAPHMLDIAKWNGSQWLPVGNGLSGAITIARTFAIFQGKLIVGGYFNTAWGDPGNNIAAWDGTSWSQLGIGTDNEVRSLAVYNNELWVGGLFSNAGGLSVTSLAKWDGTNWHSVGVTMNNVVNSMAVLGNDLYIGGAFNIVNGDTINYIMRYNYLTGFESLRPNERNIEISPNPFNNTSTISISHQFSFSDLTFKIFSIDGKLLKQFPITSTKTIYQRNGLADGIYFYQLTNAGVLKANGKFVVQ